MDNENGLQQLTVRLPLNVKEKIEGLAKSGGCSTAEIIRRVIDGNLNKYHDGVQYVDREQDEAINEIMNRFDTILEEFINVMAYTRISHTRNGRAAIQIRTRDRAGTQWP